MTRRSDLLRGVEQQLLALVALPGHPVDPASLAGPRQLFRVVGAMLVDGDPEPLVGLDSDGDLQCQWFLGGRVVTLVVDDRGAGWLWAHDGDDEVLYQEWSPGQEPREAWAAGAALLRRAPEVALHA